MNDVVSHIISKIYLVLKPLFYLWSQCLLITWTNLKLTYPETRPIPVIIPPAGTSSLPYNLWPASWDSSRNGDLNNNILFQTDALN